MTDVIAEPTLSIEAAFSTGASTGTYLHLDDAARGKLDTATLAPDVIWADITPFFLAGSVSRQSSRIESPIIGYETGTLGLTLDNSDRRFDPDHLTGPYVAGGVSQVAPRVAIRVRATWDGITYGLFRGLADDWPITDEGPSNSECSLAASDGLSVLGGIDRAEVAPVGASETTGARINRILDSAGWPAADRIVATGNSTLQATTLEGNVLTELQLVAEAEIGELYVDGDGRLVFRNRQAFMTDARSNTSQGTFGDDYGEIPYVNVQRATDVVTLYNKVRITRTGGTEQSVEDATSIAANFERTYAPSGELPLETDAEALSYAQWLLYVSKDKEVRFTEIEIEPAQQGTDLWPHVLGRQIGDLITIRRRPPGGGSMIERDCFIRGISHDFAQGFWRTKWQLQSATKYGSFLTLDNARLGKLDQNALAY